MEGLIEQVGDKLLSVVILATWVVYLTRREQKLIDKLLECLDDLKRKNREEP